MPLCFGGGNDGRQRFAAAPSGQVSLSLVLGLGIALCASLSFAEGALATGLPNGDPHNGFVVGVAKNEATAEEARSKALQDCQGSDIKRTDKARSACKIVETFHDQCANDAINGDRDTLSTAVGWAVGPDSETTNARAMTMCETMRRGRGKDCHPDGEPICDGKAK